MNGTYLAELNTLTYDGMETDASCAASVRNDQRRAITAPLGPDMARDEPLIYYLCKQLNILQ